MKKEMFKAAYGKLMLCFLAAWVWIQMPVNAEEVTAEEAAEEPQVIIVDPELFDSAPASVSGNTASKEDEAVSFTIKRDLNDLKIAKTNVKKSWTVGKGDTYKDIIKELKKIKPKNSKKTIQTGDGTQDYILCWVDSKGNIITEKSKITGNETLKPVWASVKITAKKKKEKLNVVVHSISIEGGHDRVISISRDQKKKSITEITVATQQGESDTIKDTWAFDNDDGKGAIKGETYKITINYTGKNASEKSSKTVKWIYSPLPIKSIKIGKYDAKDPTVKVPLILKWTSKDIDGWELYESKTGKKKDYKMIVDYAVWIKQINIGRKRAVKGVAYKGRTYFFNRDGKKVYSDWSDVAKVKK